jgi:glycosyltransferase involved in cell wall biosynthesis
MKTPESWDEERARLQQEVADRTWERDRYSEELHDLRNRLAEIQGSKMWRLWMLTIALRKPWYWLLDKLAWLGREIVRLPLLPFRVARWVGRVVAPPLGWLYLAVSVPCRRLLARVRRPDSPESLSPGPAEPEFDRRPRVLIVLPAKIWPADSGGGVRLYNLVRRLGESCDVYLLIFSRDGEDEAQRLHLADLCKKIYFHKWTPQPRPDRWGLLPPNAQLFKSWHARQAIEDIVLIEGIDIVQLESTELGQYVDAVPQGVPVILTEHAIEFRSLLGKRRLRFERRFPESNIFGKSKADWSRLVDYEVKWSRRADQVHTLSLDDGRYLAGFLQDGADRIRVVPNGVDTDEFAPGSEARQRDGVLFVGNFQNSANVDALEVLATDIWPLVRMKIEDARLTVVGTNCYDRISRFHDIQGINVVGRVPSPVEYYQRHKVVVVPTRAGSGARLTILEAFASGAAVVSTALGAEGIDSTDGENIIIAEHPVDIASAIVRLLTDDSLCRRMAENGRELALSTYDWDLVTTALLGNYDELVPRRRATLPPPHTEQGTWVHHNWEPSDPDVTVIIPTLNGGDSLREVLTAIRGQESSLTYEILIVDSQSDESDITMMRDFGARVLQIERAHFNHGLTRDLAAHHARGRVLVFLNQDAVPAGPTWLQSMCEPLMTDDPNLAAIQGGMREVPDESQWFFWHSCGERFYFTREAGNWFEQYHGIGFSTVNCAIKRWVWERTPFGRCPVSEDKKWQRAVFRKGFRIEERQQALLYHTHNYDLRELYRRCVLEGYGWRFLGITYSGRAMLGDLLNFRVHRELIRGLRNREIRSAAELLFPWIRPLTVFWGNRFKRSFKY